MEEVSLAVAFGAGLLSFLSPCMIPMVPVYLANLSGPEVLESGTRKRRLRIFLRSLSFVSGFLLVFVLFGAGAGLLGSVISQHLNLARKVSGSLLVAFGLFMLVALKVSWLNYEKQFSSSRLTTRHFRNVLTGSVFALGWTPCVSPILGGILAFAMSSESVWHGTYLLSVYSLGMGLPFLVAGVAFDAVTPLLRGVNRYGAALHVASAVLMIGVGILVLSNRIIWFQQLAT